jgi:proline dehydrogenase
MSILAHSKSPILSPDTNPLLRHFLKKTFYKQFCAGENAGEITQTIDGLKTLGFKGVILNYAREVSPDEEIEQKLASTKGTEADEACKQEEIIPWANGTMQTVKLVTPDDYVAVKFTGAGRQAVNALRYQQDPPPALREAIDSICELAASRGVRLLFDAENASLQPGIDAWTLDYMRKYNKLEQGKAIVYGTYQAYLKSVPEVLASHIAAGRKEGFTVGIKLVRGAYLGSDPRHLIHDTKEDTDNAYDSISESLARRSYGTVLKPAAGESGQEFPDINVVLAQHNQTSVRKIQEIRNAQIEKGEEQIDLVHAQLQGMADNVSCELVHAGRVAGGEKKVDIPQAYKYLVWGTTGECMKYLLRRAQENKDAVQRTREGRDAMAAELIRRIKKAVGMVER